MNWINEKFVKIADTVSYVMGTPANIIIWILLVAMWFALGFFVPHLFLTATFLPAWFTSTAWNFPLNTITTLAELYIGFLVAAAANRSEKHLHNIIEDTDSTIKILKKNIDNMQQDLDKTHKMLGLALDKLGVEDKNRDGIIDTEKTL